MLKKTWEGVEGNAIYLDFKSEAWPTEVKPFFCTTKKDDSGTRVINETFDEIKATVKRVEKNETEYKGQPVYAFRIYLQDGDEEIVLSPTYTNGSKNMLNALLGSIDKEVVMRPYLNKKGYPDVSVKINWEFAPTVCEYNDKDLKEKIWALAKDRTEVETSKEWPSIEDLPF